ncbi:T9SS type A sorting domain-containing protein [Pseudobacter ginsenosidimutans]|uniref:Putative secreted protein (Por secretion system target) n=1 Tax=Pseudobacter ginsenosidimutans TaxID=661488 RepID=A0A4Q7N5M9_9BACT|nr:T9SS type A sorting domain-containing protein [Pseudobacter ginsenosidimutans]QEC44870.1 T9SS type A sorting domain-containing protein [Pseudobacter ginsenosidimutans]RZS76361.1 putative secreted protein (Por secretion system target) [Pseudobacter ginsenosidimutans]
MKKMFFLLLLSYNTVVQAQTDPAYPTAPATPGNIVAAEYFIDTDPGVGNGTAIPVTPGTDISNISFNANTGSLSEGAHTMYVRTLNTDGRWAITHVRQFVADYNPGYSTAPATPGNIVAAEYFIDTDPGIGNATTIPLTPGADISNISFNANTSGLSGGMHTIYLRTLSTEGRWSITNMRQFVADYNPAYPTAPAAPQNIVAAEYFIDTDPGIGNATAIPVTPGTDLNNISFNANTSSLATGAHNIYVRTLNSEGRWAVTNLRQFVSDDDWIYPAPPAAPGNITRVEYFIDTDPGFGNGTPITITPGVDLNNISIDIPAASISEGQHILYIRSLDDWSITNYSPFMVSQALPLHFLSFTAAGSGKDVLLNWTTTDEVNTATFEIEISADNEAFERIHSIPAKNTSGVHHYSFIHRNVPATRLLYRLKQTDIDGGFEYSKIAIVNMRQAVKISLYPNPANHNIMLKNIKPQDVSSVDILSMEGKRMVLFNAAFNNQYHISTLPPGTYVMKIVKKDGSSETLSFVKQ